MKGICFGWASIQEDHLLLRILLMKNISHGIRITSNKGEEHLENISEETQL